MFPSVPPPRLVAGIATLTLLLTVAPGPASAATEPITASLVELTGPLDPGRCHISAFVQYPDVPGATGYSATYFDKVRNQEYVSAAGPDTDDSEREPFAGGQRLPPPNDFLTGAAGPCDDIDPAVSGAARFEILEASATLPDDRPTAAFTFSGTGPVVFDASTSSGNGTPIVEYRWSFGDDTAGDGVSVEHEYDEPGTYAVMLTVVNADGVADVEVNHVEVAGGDLSAAITYQVRGQGEADREVTIESEDDALEAEIFPGDDVDYSGEGWGGDADPIVVTLDGAETRTVPPAVTFEGQAAVDALRPRPATDPDACSLALEAVQAETSDEVTLRGELMASTLVSTGTSHHGGTAVAVGDALCTGWDPDPSGGGLLVADDAHTSHGIVDERAPDWTGWYVAAETAGRTVRVPGVLTNYLIQRADGQAQPRLVARPAFAGIGALPGEPTAAGLRAGSLQTASNVAGTQLRLTTSGPKQVAGSWDRIVARDVTFLGNGGGADPEGTDSPCRQVDPSGGSISFVPYIAVNGSLFLGGRISGAGNIVARTIWLDAETDLSPCSSNGSSPALSMSAEMVIIGPIPGMQWTTSDAAAGDTDLAVNGDQGFEPGDEVVIDAGNAQEETVTIAGDGSFAQGGGATFTLAEPLARDHQPGAIVTNLTSPPEDFPGIGTNAGAGHVGAERIVPAGGADPIAVAIAWSQRAFPDDGADRPDEVLLGTQDVFADSLASGGAQGRLGAPLLLDQQLVLDDRVRAEIQRLGVDTVYLLGGEAALSAQHETALREEGVQVVRLSGPSRIDTAVAIAEALLPEATTAYLVRAFGDEQDESRAFADSLGVGGAAATQRAAVLLTQTDVLSTATADYLARSGITEVVIAGGEAAVSATVEQQVRDLGVTVRRASGATRHATAVAIAEEAGYPAAGDAEGVILLQGSGDAAWPDGLVAALTSAQQRRPLALVDGSDVPSPTAAWLRGGLVDLLCASVTDDDACVEAATLLATP